MTLSSIVRVRLKTEQGLETLKHGLGKTQPTSLCALDLCLLEKEEVDLRSLPSTVSFREIKGVSFAQTAMSTLYRAPFFGDG